MAAEDSTVLGARHFIFPSCDEGYDPASVDVFALEMHRKLLAAENEVLRLKEDLEAARRERIEVGSFEEAEAAIGRAMLVAERHADQARRLAEEETRQIVETARVEAEELRSSARAEADRTLEQALQEAERLATAA